MDWGASPSSWTCGFSEYTCTPGNGATDLRDCPAIYEDSIVVAPREMRSESEKRFEALMGEGGGDAAVPVAAVEHLEVGDAAPRDGDRRADGPPPGAAAPSSRASAPWPRTPRPSGPGATTTSRARPARPPSSSRLRRVLPRHDFATRGAYDAFVAAGGWAAYPGAVCAAVELDDLWEVDGGFRVAGARRLALRRRVAAELDSRKLDRVAPAAPPRLALANARPAACDLAAAPGDDDARSPVFERAYALPAGLELAAPGDGAQFPSTSRRRRSASPSTRTARPARPRSGCPWAGRSRSTRGSAAGTCARRRWPWRTRSATGPS
ncbi:hypothetical protein JL722_8800 [Aureococcus anophagefferens]|nr:hypothetical protein JL722_8800 [Aureococcus anophagefferens]